MAHTTMSFPALYDYAKNQLNIDIFSDLSLPSAIDASTLKDWILYRSAPYEVLYPNPEYMQAAVKTWSLVHARTFQKWCDALAIQYDPLNNYDRTETFNETGLESASHSNEKLEYDIRAVNDTTLDSSSRTQTDQSVNNSTTIGSDSNVGTNDNTTTDSVSAFDSATWQNSAKSVVDGDTTSTGDNMQSTNGRQSGTTANEDERMTANTVHDNNTINDSQNGTNDVLNSKNHRLRAFGNIGVTSSQQLLQSELDIDAWNVYEHITDMFIDEFCVLLF